MTSFGVEQRVHALAQHAFELRLGHLEIGARHHQVALRRRHLGLGGHQIEPGPQPGLVAAVVVVVEVLGRRQRFLRYLHRLPEAGQIPVGILDLRQRSGYLQPEDLLRGLQVVLGHVDESHIGDEAAPVEQRLVEAGSEPRNERRIEPQMLLRCELPDDAHARKVARPLGQKLGIAGAPGQRVGHHRRHARHHGRVQRRDVAVEAEIETQRGVERPHLPDLQRASAPRDAARRAHAASSRGGVHAGPQDARVQPAGKRCARDAARRLSGLRAQKVRLSDRTQVALHLDIEITELNYTPSLRKAPVQKVLADLIKDGGPILHHGDSEEQQRSFEPTCRKLWRFLNKSQG